MRKEQDRNMFFENQGYFQTPQMMGPMMPNMYANNTMQMGPNVPMGMAQPLPGMMPNGQFQDVNSLEQRVIKLEKQMKRMDSRIARIENKLNLDANGYQISSDGYNVSEANLYMM